MHDSRGVARGTESPPQDGLTVIFRQPDPFNFLGPVLAQRAVEAVSMYRDIVGGETLSYGALGKSHRDGGGGLNVPLGGGKHRQAFVLRLSIQFSSPLCAGST
jgi:hypothetical protein